MLGYNAPHNNEIVVGYNATSRGQVMREAATADIGKLAEKKSENVQWYDTATARIVRTHFQADFERFNFSRNPVDMDVDSSEMQAEFAAAEANLKTMALL